MKDPILQIANLTASYGSIEVVHGVSMKVAEGGLVTVIGANGAGKSTLLNSIMGLVRATGELQFGGQSLSPFATERRFAAGLSLVPERRELFPDLTVEDNLLLGAFWRGREARLAKLGDVFARFPRLKERRTQTAGTLSGGERQMLALGRALMSDPKMLMLDEPSLGLAPRIVKDVFQILLALKQTGISILLVEQNARAALQVADYAYVMELGRFVKEGSPSDISQDPELVASYLGLGKMTY